MTRLNTLERELYTLCVDFIREHDITCAETVYQTDRVANDALPFIESICSLLGYEEPIP